MCQLNSIAKGQKLYPALYFILPVLVGAVLPHLAFVVHATYAVEFDIELFGRTVVSSGYSFPVFHMCKDVLDRNTPFVMCFVLCLFGGGKLFALGFFVRDLCVYPKVRGQVVWEDFLIQARI